MRHDHGGISIPSFVEMGQVYTDKTTTSLKANAIDAYPVHTVLLNYAATYRRYLIDHRHTFVGFLPVSSVEEKELSQPDNVVDCGFVSGSNPVVLLTDEMPHTFHRNERDVMVAILQAATQKKAGFERVYPKGTGSVALWHDMDFSAGHYFLLV